MSVARSRPGRSPADWDRIAARLARGAGLSPEDVRRVLAGLQHDGHRRSLDAALTQWLDQDESATREGAPAVAEIPPPTARPASELRFVHDAASAHAERIRALRTELLLRQGPGRPTVLAILSPGACDGRSRLAAELAIAFSQTGEPTLLVDGDLRRPRQHALFGANREAGLAEALASGGSPPLQGVHDLPELALVTAGEPPADPLERLSGGRLADLLAGLSRQFRHIIVDTPPAAAYSDALVLAMQCSATVIVCRAGRTRLEDLHHLLHRLALTPARALGTVLSRF